MKHTRPARRVAAALLEHPHDELHGYGIYRATVTRGEPVDWPVVYRMLRKLTAAGALDDLGPRSPGTGRPARRTYRFTPGGRAQVHAWLAAAPDEPAP